MIRRSIFKWYWLALCSLIPFFAHAQVIPFYNIDSIQEIRVYFSFPNWDYRLDTAASSVYESFTVARQVKINGVVFDSVGAKYKGNSTFRATNKKNPWHFELDHVKGAQQYQGLKDIKLSNVWSDPSFVRESLSFDILKNYMHCPRANFARVYVNDTLMGLYTNTEAITKTFCRREFVSAGDNVFVKCNAPGGGAGGANRTPNLAYLTNDSTRYYPAYELKSNYGWKELMALCDTLANKPTSMEKIMDMDRAIWMGAFNALVLNLDSYSGGIGHNYYLWKDDNGRFNPISWDMNMSFASFKSTGTTPANLDSLSAISVTPFLHQGNTARPLLKLMLENPLYRRQYVAHMKTMLNEMFLSGYYKTAGLNHQRIIDLDVQRDTNKFYLYSSFKPNLYYAQSGSAAIATANSFMGIISLMDKRSAWIRDNVAEFAAQPPTMTNRTVTPASPRLNNVIWVTTRLTNSNYAYVGWRSGTSEIFKKVQLLDDGLNQDGAANDGVFGASFPALSATMQYYIYAENTQAGLFSPERAEHEFHTITVDITQVTPITRGQLVLNEIMAINTKTVVAPNGKYGDWVELHNRTNNALNIGGVTISDDRTFLTKWRVPANTVIAPNGYLIVWGTDDSLINNDLQMSFKLTGMGEALYMMAPSPVALLDSVTFPRQRADTTWARYPNGTGNWRFLNPTFKATNSLTANEEVLKQLNLKIYPNPTDGLTIIESTDNEPLNRIQVFDASGRLLRTEKAISESKTTLDWGNLPNGVYFIRVQTQKVVPVVLQR
jgi:spore coat protein CotH